ncbi:hypothetical protein C8F01DRAFT_1092111 [Mycena amicta]|nr:hypothetical protein C8F01DRAFT_1092111 [Mycena amicta]
MHVDENTFVLASTWEPPMALSQIMSRVVHPSIFILQHRVDPDFSHEFSDKMFPSGALKAYQSEIRKVLQILYLIRSQGVRVPTQLKMKLGVDPEEIDADNFTVNDHCWNMLDIFEALVNLYGFTNEPTGRYLMDSLRYLVDVAHSWQYLLNSHGKYLGYAASGQLIKRPLITGW